MAQSGYTPILIYASGTASNTPSSSNLTTGASGAELAINYTDGKLFYKDGAGTVQTIASKASVTGTVSSVGFTGGLISVATATTTPALTVAGTSGGVVYFSSASTWASSTALTQYGAVYGGGAGAAPVATAAGTTGQVLSATTGGAPTWSSTYAGTVTSVGFTGGIVSVATATTTPAFTIAGTSGGIPYFSSASTWASSTALTQYGIVYGGGAGAAPVSTAAGTTGQVLTATTGGAPTWSSTYAGTVTSASVTTGNGFAGTVATSATTPAITISTNVTGLLFGNGTAMAAATISSPLSYSAGTLSIPVASGSANGYLSSTDWTTFNSKGSGSGSVTSVGFTGGIISVATATTTPALTVAGTSGGIPYFSSASTWASSGALTQYALVLGGGAGSAPTVLASLGTTSTVLHGNAAGSPSFGAVSLTADVSGTLPIGNGGTNSTATPTAGGIGYGTGTAHAYTTAGTSGQALISAAAAAPSFGTLGVAGGGTGQTTYAVGDILYASSTSALSKLNLGTANQILAVNSGATGLTWTSAATAGVSSITFGTTGLTPSTASTGAVTVAGTLSAANGGTGVANNVLATVTSVGNYSYTRRLSAATDVTFPTTGTLATLAGSETLTNKTLTTPVISSISNTGTLTLPTSNDTLVGRATTDTLTNKTLTNPTITNYTETLQAVGTVGASSTLALTNGTVLTATLTASTPCTFAMPTATAGKSFILILTQAATGMTTATFTGVKWPGGTAPTITATASAVDILSFAANGTSWYGSAAQAFA